jgi:hypothetical protein
MPKVVPVVTHVYFAPIYKVRHSHIEDAFRKHIRFEACKLKLSIPVSCSMHLRISERRCSSLSIFSLNFIFFFGSFCPLVALSKFIYDCMKSFRFLFATVACWNLGRKSSSYFSYTTTSPIGIVHEHSLLRCMIHLLHFDTGNNMIGSLLLISQVQHRSSSYTRTEIYEQAGLLRISSLHANFQKYLLG